MGEGMFENENDDVHVPIPEFGVKFLSKKWPFGMFGVG